MNTKFLAPELEEFEEKRNYYAFTLSPSENQLLLGSNNNNVKKNALYKWWQKLRETLNVSLRFCRLDEIHVELSHTGRPHIHSYINVKKANILYFYMHDLPQLQSIGTYAICKAEYNQDLADKREPKYTSWDAYLTKQDTHMKKYFDKRSPFEYPFSMEFDGTTTGKKEPDLPIADDHLD